MDQNEKTRDTTTSVEELAAKGMFLSEALYEILADKGLVTHAEIIARIRKLKSETKVNLHRPN